MAAGVRDAGALALSMFGRPIRNWTKFESSPVSDADIAVDRLLHERLANGRYLHRLAVRRKRRRSVPPRRALPLDCRSDRRHAGLSCRLAGLERLGGAGRQRPAGRRPVFMRRRASNSSWRSPVAARPATACRSRRPPAPRSNNLRIAGPRKLVERLTARKPSFSVMPRVALAGAAIGSGRAGHLRCRHRRSQQSRLGPCGCRSFGARSGWRAGAGWGRQRHL